MADSDFHIKAESCSEFCSEIFKAFEVYQFQARADKSKSKSMSNSKFNVWALCHEQSDSNYDEVSVDGIKLSEEIKINSAEQCVLGSRM